MKTIKVKCEQCKKEFDKIKKEFTRCEKEGTRHFCTQSCACSYRNNHMPDEYWKKHNDAINIKQYAGNRLSDLSPFKSFLNKGRFSIQKHKGQIDVDVEYLKELWEYQDGTCPYTNIKMMLPRTCKRSDQFRALHRASLDRIDSSKGYLKGNVEFVCYAINLAKNNFSKQDMLNFISIVRSNGNTLGITQSQPT